MNKYIEILCLNKRHSMLVCAFLDDLQDVISEVTYYKDDEDAFGHIIEGFIYHHNGLGSEVSKGEIDNKSWYYSLANNAYWATQGYFANLEDKENVLFCEKKVLSLITEFLKSAILEIVLLV